MRVKKYIASNMPEAIKMIKEELGPQAIIISTRKIKKGSGAFGLFGKEELEVTAAKDEKRNIDTPDGYSGNGGKRRKSSYEKELSYNAPKSPRKDKVNDEQTNKISSLRNDMTELKELIGDIRKGFRRQVNDDANVSHLRYELSDLKNMINSLISHSGQLKAKDLHENLIALYQQMCFNGIEES